MSDLTCAELVELVTDYLEGRLSPAVSARFEGHLAGCGGCRNYLEQVRETVLLTGRLGERDLAGPERDRLLAAFRGWKR